MSPPQATLFHTDGGEKIKTIFTSFYPLLLQTVPSSPLSKYNNVNEPSVYLEGKLRGASFHQQKAQADYSK